MIQKKMKKKKKNKINYKAKDNKAKEKTLNWTRLETWAMPGGPDVVLQDDKGRFHFVELKATGSNAVDLRPHQVSWLTKHGHGSVWILVKQQTSKMPKAKLYLFGGTDAVNLKMEGLTSVESYAEQESPFDWEEILHLILLYISLTLSETRTKGE